MGILFHQETKTFHLYNKEVSYIIRIMENGQLENLYYGKAIRDREDFTHLHEEMSRPLTSVCIHAVHEAGISGIRHRGLQKSCFYGETGKRQQGGKFHLCIS